MTDPVELEMEDDSELKDQPVKDPEHHDPLKELDLDETNRKKTRQRNQKLEVSNRKPEVKKVSRRR